MIVTVILESSSSSSSSAEASVAVSSGSWLDAAGACVVADGWFVAVVCFLRHFFFFFVGDLGHSSCSSV